MNYKYRFFLKGIILILFFLGCFFCLNIFSECRFKGDKIYSGKFIINDVFDRRYLAIDETLYAELHNMHRVMGQADNQKNLELKGEKESTTNKFGHILSVLNDHEGHLRMYYSQSPTDELLIGGRQGGFMSMALSDDGLNWVKPILKIAPFFKEYPVANAINVKPHPGMIDKYWYRAGPVFFDSQSPLESRYKLSWRVNDSIYVATSSDGLNFITHGLAIKHKADTHHSAFYDPYRREYVMYGRKRGDWKTGPADRRGVVLHSSKNWTDIPWSNIGQIVIDPMDVWDYTKRIRPQVYAPAIQIYHGQYIGLPAIFFVDEGRIPFPRPDRKTGTFYPMVMYSHDGIHWTFPDLWHPIINIEPHERISTYEHASFKGKEVGMIWNCSNFIEIDNKYLLIYYRASEKNHYEPCPPNHATNYVAFMRVDGFASVQTIHDDIAGEWITTEIKVPEGTGNLIVNANIIGNMRVEVFDAATGEPVNGLTLGNSIEVTGDKTNFIMKWKNDTFEKAAGYKVRLRFVVTNGKIYSFSFKPVKN